MEAAAKVIELSYAPRRQFVPYRANFWRGLVSRWDKALVKAQEFQKEQGAIPAVIKRTINTGVAGGAVTYTFWDWIVAHPILSLLTAAGMVSLVIFAWRTSKAWRDKPLRTPAAPSPVIIKDI